MSLRCLSVAALCVLSVVSTARAEVSEKKIEYTSGDTKMIGYYFSDSSQKGARPAILLFSDWLGVGDFAKARAKEFVAKGYRAFVADVYGGGKIPSSTQEALRLSNSFERDRLRTRERAKAGYYTLLKQPGVEEAQIAAVGFTFGGMVALELAREGVPLQATIAFHAPLNTPNASLANNIVGKVLVLHGANDPFVKEKEVNDFRREMQEAKVVWELVEFGQTFHAFTNPAVGIDPFSGAAYNAWAAKRAYGIMNLFLQDVFSATP